MTTETNYQALSEEYLWAVVQTIEDAVLETLSPHECCLIFELCRREGTEAVSRDLLNIAFFEITQARIPAPALGESLLQLAASL